MLALGMPKGSILDFFYPDIDVGQMKEIREVYEQHTAKEQEEKQE